MRIKSITVRNYRVHRDLPVQLDDSRTLIRGPNECGKSTLVEAVHRAFFLKSKATSQPPFTTDLHLRRRLLHERITAFDSTP